MFLFFFFVILPVLEIALFVWVIYQIGVIYALGIAALTTLLGIGLLSLFSKLAMEETRNNLFGFVSERTMVKTAPGRMAESENGFIRFLGRLLSRRTWLGIQNPIFRSGPDEPVAVSFQKRITKFSGAILLILPGFITDFLGILFLLPGGDRIFRRLIQNRLDHFFTGTGRFSQNYRFMFSQNGLRWNDLDSVLRGNETWEENGEADEKDSPQPSSDANSDEIIDVEFDVKS